jgi:hypothetical protein
MAAYRRTRREAVIAGLLWAGFALWVLTASYQLGYRGEYSTTLGMPSWIIWGVLVPWIAAVVVNTVFVVFIMADDDEGSC